MCRLIGRTNHPLFSLTVFKPHPATAAVAEAQAEAEKSKDPEEETAVPKAAATKGKKKSKPVNKDRFISKMFLRGDSVILVLKNPH